MKWPTCLPRPRTFQIDCPTGDNIGQYWNSFTPGLTTSSRDVSLSVLSEHTSERLPSWPLWRLWMCRSMDFHFSTISSTSPDRVVKREDWQPSSTTRICSEHFISGRPAQLIQLITLNFTIHPEYTAPDTACLNHAMLVVCTCHLHSRCPHSLQTMQTQKGQGSHITKLSMSDLTWGSVPATLLRFSWIKTSG